MSANPSTFNLGVEFLSLQTLAGKEISSSDKRLEVVNYFNEIKTYLISGVILGYHIRHNIDVDGNGTYKMPFKITKTEGSKEFSFKMSKEDFIKLTDFSVQILDETGKAVSQNTLTYRNGGTVGVEMNADKDSVNYILEIVPAFANKELKLNLTVDESAYLPVALTVSTKSIGKPTITLYPNSSKYVDLEFSKPDLIIPAEAEVYGKIYFKSPSTEQTEYELPIRFIF